MVRRASRVLGTLMPGLGGHPRVLDTFSQAEGHSQPPSNTSGAGVPQLSPQGAPPHTPTTPSTHVAIVNVEDVDLGGRLHLLHAGPVPGWDGDGTAMVSPHNHPSAWGNHTPHWGWGHQDLFLTILHPQTWRCRSHPDAGRRSPPLVGGCPPPCACSPSASPVGHLWVGDLIQHPLCPSPVLGGQG